MSISSKTRKATTRKAAAARTAAAARSRKPKAATTSSVTTPPSAASRVLSPSAAAAAALSSRHPLRSVEVPGLGPNDIAAIAFYRPLSAGMLVRISEMSGKSPIEQIRIVVDHLAEVWVTPAGTPYPRDEILALDAATLGAVSTAILTAKDLEVADHEALLAELGIDPATHAPAGDPLDALLSPNASGGAPSSAKSTV